MSLLTAVLHCPHLAQEGNETQKQLFLVGMDLAVPRVKVKAALPHPFPWPWDTDHPRLVE